MLTNKKNIPDCIFRAILNDSYDSKDCDISTTRLISPPQLVELQRRHKDQIEEDASEKIWILIGQSIHTILERSSDKNKTIVEKRYSARVEGWEISGQIDLIENEVLYDFKVTSVYTYIYDSRREEWTAQANVNNWLCNINSQRIKELKNVLILRDWVKSKADTGKYPGIQIVTVPLEMWDMKKAENYILERVKIHQVARKMSDEELAIKIPCSHEERWWNEKKQVYIRCEQYCSCREVCLTRKFKPSPVSE